jgi:Na+/proline symporter
MKNYVFISAAFLVVGVLYFKSWADYPAFLLNSDATKDDFEAYTSLSNAYISFVGIQYTLILAAYALPISYVQAGQSDLICKNIIEKSGPSASHAARKATLYSVKREEGLELSINDVIKIILLDHL